MRKVLLGNILLILSQLIIGQTPGTIASDQAICYGLAPASLTNAASASGFTPSASYRWQYSTDNNHWVNIASGATRNTYSPPALTVTTYYRRGAFSATQDTLFSNVVTITVGPEMNAGTIGSAQTICYNSNAVALNTVNTPIGVTSPVYNWQYSTDNVTWTNVSSGNGRATYTPRNMLVSTWFRRQVTNFSCGGTRNSNTVLITVRTQLNPGVIGPAQTICYNSIPTPINQTTPASGGNGVYTYQWQSSPNNNNNYVNVTGATSASLSFSTALTANSYYRRIVYSEGCSATSAPILVTVTPNYTAGTIGQNQTICYNTAPNQLTQVLPATGGTGVFTYQWQMSTNNTSWTNISGATSTAYSPTVLTSTTYFRRLTYSGSCGNRASNTVTITVNNALLSGTIGAAQSICYNTTPVALTQATLPSGGTGTYSYQWQTSSDNITWSNIAGATSSTYLPSALVNNTWYRMGVTSGSCGTVYTAPVLITVNAQLTAGSVGSTQNICANSSPAILTELTTATGGTGSFTYQWQSSADNSAWSDIPGATGTTFNPSVLTSTTWFRRLVSSGSCTSVASAPVQITVYPAITQVLFSSNDTIDNNLSTNFSITITGGTGPFLINYNRNGVAQTSINGYTTGSPISTGVLTTGQYVYTITSVIDAHGCTILNPATSVTISVLRNTTYHFNFTYPDRSSLVADGWDFIATGPYPELVPRNTEQTSGAVVSYDQVAHPGVIRIPVDIGGLWVSDNNSRNTLFRDLPLDWSSVRMMIKSFTPTTNYQSVSLAIYQNDNNYLEIARAYNDKNRIMLSSEAIGVATSIATVDENATSNIILRLDRNPENEEVTAYYSLNGTTWISVGSEIHSVSLAYPHNPRLAILCGGSLTGLPQADIEWAEIITNGGDELRAYPGDIVFNAQVGQTITNTRPIYVYTTLDRNIPWVLTSDSQWLTTNIQSGFTEGQIRVGVNTTGLSVGTHTGHITLQSYLSTIPPVTLPVTVIINPVTPVTGADWYNGYPGAMSVSVDNGDATGFQQLVDNGFVGTYVSNYGTPPPFYASYFNAGMELGSHLYDHDCVTTFSELTFRNREIGMNISGLVANTPASIADLISLVWPCGTQNYHMQAVASEYFLSGRGYNFNKLEDANPDNFMNLKSYNTHGHIPNPPANLITVVDSAINLKKWFNLVLHESLLDDGAIAYAKNKDIWVTSIGKVVKFIYQRNRLIVSSYTTATNSFSFGVSRTSVPSSAYRNFESSFNSSDLITLRIDYDDTRLVEGVTINGVNTPYTTRIIDANHYLFANVLVEPSNVKTVVVNYVDESVPRIILSENQLNFNAVEGENPVAQTFNVTSNLPQLLNWTAAVSSSDGNWLSINPTSGTGTTAVTVNVDVSGLVSGTYTKTITVSAVGASNTPQVKTVTLLVTPAGYLHIDFNYTDREALVSNGWDFIAYTNAGVPRNTEQLSGAVVSFDQIAHPGVIRIPVDLGELWASNNSTRNSLFRTLPATWESIRMKVASFNPTANYQAVSLVAYQDDDHYMEVSRGYNSGNSVAFVIENGLVYPTSYSQQQTFTTNFYLRIDRDRATQVMTAYFSTNGSTWSQIGVPTAQTLTNPRLAVITGGSSTGYPPADIEFVEVLFASNLKSATANTNLEKDNSLQLSDIPSETRIYQNYPNPFISETMIEYDVNENGKVLIELYNSTGQKVRSLVNEIMVAGKYSLNFIAGDLPKGIYYLKLTTRNYSNSIKMILLN